MSQWHKNGYYYLFDAGIPERGQSKEAGRPVFLRRNISSQAANQNHTVQHGQTLLKTTS